VVSKMAAERAQNYLDRHKIGPLFENLMASLIKDMPNEPITYLIRMLQKADQRLRSPRGVPDRTKSASSSTLHSKYGIGVAGHAAPKRSIEEPHMALPGGGKAAGIWSSTDLSSSQARSASAKTRPKTAEQKKRGYDKPWLPGSKTGSKKLTETSHRKEKTMPEHREATDEKVKKAAMWNSDTKVTAKDFDDMQQTQQTSQSPTAKENKMIEYEGVKSWAAGDEASYLDKRGSLQHESRRALFDITNDEIDIQEMDSKKRKDEMNADSEMEIIRGKKTRARSNANAKRMKLKALLDDNGSRNSLGNVHEDSMDSSDDEAIEVFEYANDLEDEGVQKVSKSGARVKSRQSDDSVNFQIKIFTQHGKVMTKFQTAGEFSDFDSQVSGTQRKALSDITGSEEDFESVSQIADPQSQRWPSIPPDDEKEPPNVTSGSNVSAGKTEFFAANAPSRSIQIQKEAEEPEVDSQMGESPKMESPVGEGQAWALKAAESSTDFSP